MYIQPNTTVKLLKGVPLDDSYEHTIFFSANRQADQLSFFNSFDKLTFENYTYQRVEKNVIRVQALADDLYACNYMMFQNTNYGNKWFFAFIQNIEYVNNITSDVTYTIDYMQTWHFDYTIEDCFVDRQHSTTDVVGDNLILEEVDLGTYVRNEGGVFNPNNMSYPENCKNMVITTFNTITWESTIPIDYDGIPTSLFFRLMSTGAVQNFLEELLEYHAELIDGLIQISVVPWWFAQTDDVEHITLRESVNKKQSGTLDGYTPRNKKLYTYPYNYLRISDDTQMKIFRYELFKDSGVCNFQLNEVYFPVASAEMHPLNYEVRSDGVGSTNFEQRLSISQFPQSAISADIYKVFIAQNQSYLNTLVTSQGTAIFKSAFNASSNLLSSFVNMVQNPTDPNTALSGVTRAGNGLISLAETVQNINLVNSKYEDLDRIGSEMRGNQTSVADYNIGAKIFRWDNMCLKSDYLRIIDNFFDMYGYKQSNLLKPYRCARNKWTYLKTIACDIDGRLPVEAIKSIKNILDRGITFWRYTTNAETKAVIGNYIQYASQNTPLGNSAEH